MKWPRLSLSILLILLVATLMAVPASAHPSEQGRRPSLPGEQTYGTQHFLIHYTVTGNQAINPSDANANGLPDYVEQVGETLEFTWRVEIDVMGWPPPAGDRGEGGDTRMDVYLDEVLGDGYAGYVETEGGFLGDNPATPEQERRAHYAYMVLDDDYLEVDEESGETPLELMQATVAHEFNHAIQAGIDDEDLHFWLYEATASWMEDQVFDDVNDVVFYLDSVFKNPDICLVAEVARGDDQHWYGEWLLLRYMSERYGPDVVRVIWENMRQVNGFRAIDTALAPFGSRLEEETRGFAAANLLRAYEEGSTYPTVRVEGEAETGTFTPLNGVQSLGADYVHLTGNGLTSVTLVPAEMFLSIQAVGIRGREADLIVAQGDTLTIDLDNYDDAYVIVHNAERIADEAQCRFVDYTLEISAANSPLSAGESVWPADNYVSPITSPISATGGGTATYRPPDEPYAGNEEYATSPADLNVSFQTIIPQTLPPGYEFDYAYIMTAADFGESAMYYVPAGGDSANYDYLDAEGNWLSIAESPSPYATVQEWLSDINYDTPGEIRNVAGVDVLIEDLSEGNDIWFSATLILNGLFIVVDGDHAEQDVMMLVESLIAAAGQPQPQPAITPAGPENPQPATPAVAPGNEEMPRAFSSQDMLVLLTSAGMGVCGLGLCLIGLLLPLGIVAVILLRNLRRG